MGKVIVIDSIMGSGKTTWAKNYMSAHKDEKKFIYVSPYLDEIQNNLLKDCSFLIEPDSKLGNGSKLRHFKKLLSSGDSIVTTHALFKLFDEEVIKLIQDQEYILFLDEVVDVVERINEISKEDIKLIIETKTAKVEDGKLKWLNDEYEGVYKSKYVNLPYHSKHGNIHIHNKSVLFWTYPVEVFEAFSETFILTYLFKGQIQKYYYDLHKIELTYKSVHKVDDVYTLVDYDVHLEHRSQYKQLISIYEGSLNRNYVRNNSLSGNELSSTWLNDVDEITLSRLKKNIYSFFRNKGKAEHNLWTTKLSVRNKLKGKGYTKAFITWNKRATNDYQETRNLAFVYNLYMNPIEKSFFCSKGIKVDEDLLAVSNLLQWIWRSSIRKNKPEPINIYIPSVRMRLLLNQWLDNKEIKFTYKKNGY
ncbi:DEAD/DEAH box helicase family protein [Exiguobacterium sp. FSL W8-0210]|uniref:DEAD/DEAH box helicase family protein n=1 Tax=Exiguobacterium sp. FSL W8-0210 TaxID=2921598 RepID=UPI0030F78FC4